MRLKLLGRDISKIGFGAVGFLRLPVGELRLDLGLHRIDIEIAHREDGRARWPIILPIKFDEAFARRRRSEEHTSELQSLMRTSYAVFCLKKKKHITSNCNYEYK